MKLVIVLLILLFVSISNAQDSISNDYLIGKFQPEKDSRFGAISGGYLLKQTIANFTAMQKKAKTAGIRLSIISPARTFSQQKRIWEAKWNGKMPVNSDTGELLPKPNSRNDNLSKKERALRILEFSAMPASSRHHWGTDFDLNRVDPRYWQTKRGIKEYNWLNENAADFGFCQPYIAQNTSGYNEEKWHWSFSPVSRKLTSEFERRVSNSTIAELGFLGSDVAPAIDIVGKYVLGINPKCR